MWFRLTIGREKKADPKWILPLLCRRGGVTRDEIGKIVILATETRFQVASHAAARFADAARVPDPRAPGLRIDPSRPPTDLAPGGPPHRAGPPSRRPPAGAGHARPHAVHGDGHAVRRGSKPRR
jgi:ATP-dependent RNA helicase DeaD